MDIEQSVMGAVFSLPMPVPIPVPISFTQALSVSLCLCVSNPPRHRLRLLVRQFCLQIGHFLLQPLDFLVE